MTKKAKVDTRELELEQILAVIKLVCKMLLALEPIIGDLKKRV